MSHDSKLDLREEKNVSAPNDTTGLLRNSLFQGFRVTRITLMATPEKPHDKLCKHWLSSRWQPRQPPEERYPVGEEILVFGIWCLVFSQTHR